MKTINVQYDDQAKADKALIALGARIFAYPEGGGVDIIDGPNISADDFAQAYADLPIETTPVGTTQQRLAQFLADNPDIVAMINSPAV